MNEELPDQVLILASIDWGAAWQRHQAVASGLAAEGRQVFFVENTGFRNLRLSDLSRVLGRLGRLTRRGPRAETSPSEGLTVVSPVVLPPTCSLFRALNAAFFIPALLARLSRLGLAPGATVICYLPTDTTLRIVDQVAADRVVYDCVDNFYGHPAPPADLAETEGALLERADIVLTTSRHLFERAVTLHPNVIIIHHGTSPDFLGEPRAKAPVRRLCYFGTIWSALDYEAVAALARAGLSVTLLGPIKEPPPELPAGVEFLHPVEHARLPSILKDFDALLLPYARTEYNKGVVPAKLYECLATGKPVIATSLPSLLEHAPNLYLADSPADFPALAERAGAEDGLEESRGRIAAARERTTEAQIARAAGLIESAPRRPPAAAWEGTSWPTTPVAWALCAFALALPLSIAGANIGWALAATALLWEWRRGRKPFFAAARGPLWAPLCVYVAAALAAGLLGRDPAHSLRFLNQDVHKLWVAALLPVAFARARPRALPAALAAGAAAAALIGIAQYLGLGAEPGAHSRAHAFVHPVTYGEQMGLLVLGAMAALWAAPVGGEGPRLRRVALAFCALLGAALLLSSTRGAMIGCAVGAAAIAFVRRGGRRVAAGLLVGGAALFVGMEYLRRDGAVVFDAARALLEGRLPADLRFARLTLWDVALRMGTDHPFTGVGVNNYRALLPDYHQGMFEDSTISWGTAHNLYLHHFAERGLLGLGALAYLLWTMLRRAYERVRTAPSFWSYWAWGATAAFLVMNMTEVALQTELVWLLVWTVWCAAEAEGARSDA